jgi:hypothetical protein
MEVFIVTIGGLPNIYRKIELKDGCLYGDDNLICDTMYVNKITITTTDKINELGETKED